MSDALKLYGTRAALPMRQTLEAGALSVVLEEGQLRHIRWQGREAIRGVSLLVRDVNWGTYAAHIENLKVETTANSFKVSYRARCGDAKQRLHYDVRIDGDETGVAYAADLHPETDFATNRAGFIVLHPLDGVAGETVTVTHTDGRTERAEFPKHVAANQPLFDIRTLEHEVSPGVLCACTMEGDAYELEDQRNWSDASFKTYVRPLAKPFPYTLREGQAAAQSVSVRFRQRGPAPAIVATPRAAHVLSVARECEGALPDIGIALDETEAEGEQADLGALATLAPQWVVARVHLGTSQQTLQRLHEAARAGRSRVLLEVVVHQLAQVPEIAAAVHAAGVDVSAVVPSHAALLKTVPSGFVVPELPSATALYEVARKAFPRARIGGGSLAYFTELNRNPPPRGALDFITHTTCPIIHAADDHSVMETLETLPWIFESTWHLADAREYWLGPTTLGMRFNPYGQAPAANPQLQRVAMAKVDPRQRGLFGAAFYTGYAARAARAGLRHLTLSALSGARGVVASSALESVVQGRLHPAFTALQWLARAAGKPRIAVDGVGSELEAIAYANGSHNVLLLANLTAEPQQVILPDFQVVPALVLDEEAIEAAAQDPTWGEREGTMLTSPWTLPPYAVARLQVPKR